MQLKIDAAHKSKTDNHELTLKSRDEYLKNHENRLIQQEKGNDEERERLQNLVSKMEIQLREQTRQIEQDKWKLTQEENRLKTMQVSFLLFLFFFKDYQLPTNSHNTHAHAQTRALTHMHAHAHRHTHKTRTHARTHT